VSGWYGSRDIFDDRIERRRGEWHEFTAGDGATLPGDLERLYERVLDRLPSLWDRGLGERITSGRNLTLVHGDCYLSQFLCPRDGSGHTYLIDWQDVHVDLPANDLTFALTTFWTSEQRRAGNREKRFLQCYLEGLRSAGVGGYDWEQLQWDYRLLLIWLVLHPIWDAVNGSSRGYWWPKMKCLTDAYRDWSCEELLI